MIGSCISVSQAAACAGHLPLNCECNKEVDDAYMWSKQEYLLADIIDVLQMLIWGLGGAKKKNKPNLVKRPGKADKKESKYTKGSKAMSIEEFKEISSRDRGLKDGSK